jgi:carbon-monoxide dehydrogenase medium subunit
MSKTFHQPASIDEACELVADNPDAKVIAGGQSLTLLLRTGILDPDGFIDISGLADIEYVETDDGVLRFGAGTTWAELHRSEVVREQLPSIPTLSGEIGDTQVRNRGTIGGSLSHADPAADMGTLLLCYDTELVCRSADGERVVPLEEFFTGMLETALSPDELLAEVRVTLPDTPERFGSHYEKYEHRKGGFSMVGVGAAVTTEPNTDRIEELRIGLANCGDTPMTVDAAAERARGEELDDDVLNAIEAAVTDAADPMADANASREYKRRVAGKLAVRAVERATREAI